MRSILALCLCLVFCSGCRVIGDRSVSLLSPEEKAMIEARRESASLRERNLVRVDVPEEKAWDFKWSWDRGVAAPGEPSEDHPEYDEDGNLIVSPEIVRTYRIPDIHAGLMYDLSEDKLRSLLEVEVFELKVPKLRYLPVGVTAAEQYLGVHISKRWTSVFEIETGIFLGHDFEKDRNTWGLGGLIIRF